MGATLVTPKTTSGGEIVRELVNASDGAGLHLANGGKVELANSAAAEFGTSDFSLEFVLNQTGDNVSDNYIYFTHGSGNNRLYIYNDISADVLKLNFEDSSGSLTTKTLSYDMSADYGTPTHYAMTFDRDADATLYKNGNSVATVDISSTSSIDIGDGNTDAGQFGSSGSYGVLGTFYRFRLWNKLVDAKALFERADVPLADQYGSQTNLVSGYDFTSGYSAYGTGAVVDANTFTTGGAGSGIQKSLLTVGKKYRVTVAGSSSAGDFQIQAYGTWAVLATGFGTHEFTATTAAIALTATASSTVDVTSFSITAIGAVVDMDLAFANPTQSLTVQDRAGAADGTASASGVTQVQPVVQLNSTSARIGATAATVADGDVAASGGLLVSKNQQSTTGTPYSGAVIKALPANTTNTTGVSSLALGTSTVDKFGYLISAQRAGSDGTPTLRFSSHNNSDTGTQVLTISSNGDVSCGVGNSKEATIQSTNSGRVEGNPAYSFRGDLDTGMFNPNTDNTLAFATGGAERMRISSDGDIDISTANAALTLGSTAANGSPSLKLCEQIASGDISNGFSFNVDGAGTNNLHIKRHVVSASGTDAMVIARDSGLATFSNGIAFQSATTGSGTGTGYTLDKFETGTWTPVHAAEASSSGTWNTTLAGVYTRIGDLVSVTMKITGSAMDFSSNDGYRGYSGLPFTPSQEGSAGSYATAHAASGRGPAAIFKFGSAIYLYPSKIGTGTSAIYATVTYKV